MSFWDDLLFGGCRRTSGFRTRRRTSGVRSRRRTSGFRTSRRRNFRRRR